LGKKDAFLYGFLYLYSFVVSNQINGVEEDKINKPDRPIASGAESLQAAKIRWVALTGIYLAYSYAMGVEKWTVLWILTTIAYNFLGFSDFGPTKDGCMGAGCIAQLMAAWAIGGSPAEIGWSWTKYITLYMLWPIPLQDLRDVPGDIIAGRKTTPILMGDLLCTVLSFLFFFFGYFSPSMSPELTIRHADINGGFT
jgi:4-hydroxybenzoate polyprenyltransferase